ncbi:hypothetical protein GCM10007919_50580 [Rhizobium indigoferae]|nr:hypothetical protein GCM10007919_50580 [Rhizobium indigoferae]
MSESLRQGATVSRVALVRTRHVTQSSIPALVMRSELDRIAATAALRDDGDDLTDQTIAGEIPH